MKILHAVILHRRVGTDIVSLVTDLPSGYFEDIEPLILEFRCSRGTAESYLVVNFPDVELKEVISQGT